jgi:CHAD domain-containing protein
VRTGPKTLVEAAIDEGVVRTAGRSERTTPICEVELELKEGDAAALYGIALELLHAAPLRIGAESKSDRGYALLESGKPAAVHSPTFRLDADQSLDAMLRVVGLGYLAQAIRNIPAVLAGSRDGVHQMRVALRRLRSAIQALRKLLPASGYRWSNGRLKRLLDTLGPARNWDVFAEEIVGPVIAEENVVDESHLVTQAVARARRRAHAQAAEAASSIATTRALLELLRWFEGQNWHESPGPDASGAELRNPVGKMAGGLLDGQLKRARKRCRNFVSLSPEERHKFRIALKGLRYTADLFQSLFDKAQVNAYLKKLKPLQEALGRTNDVRTARLLIEQLALERYISQAGTRLGMVVGWHEHALQRDEDRLCKRVRRFRKLRAFW